MRRRLPVLTVLVFLCSAALAFEARQPRHPASSPDGRRIAFALDRHGKPDVFVVPADGSAAPRRPTFASVADQPLDFTTDGPPVLFESRRDEGIQRTPARYTVPVCGATETLPRQSDTARRVVAIGSRVMAARSRGNSSA
jgi:hypothetical protein